MERRCPVDDINVDAWTAFAALSVSPSDLERKDGLGFICSRGGSAANPARPAGVVHGAPGLKQLVGGQANLGLQLVRRRLSTSASSVWSKFA